jgi:hypothetical protein
MSYSLYGSLDSAVIEDFDSWVYVLWNAGVGEIYFVEYRDLHCCKTKCAHKNMYVTGYNDLLGIIMQHG